MDCRAGVTSFSMYEWETAIGAKIFQAQNSRQSEKAHYLLLRTCSSPLKLLYCKIQRRSLCLNNRVTKGGTARSCHQTLCCPIKPFWSTFALCGGGGMLSPVSYASISKWSGKMLLRSVKQRTHTHYTGTHTNISSIVLNNKWAGDTQIVKRALFPE